MKKILLIIFMVLFFLSGNCFAKDRGQYESSQHKFRSQFNDNEWREHQARSQEYFRARHPEYYLYNEDRYHPRHKRDYYRYNDSLRDDHESDDWRDDSDEYDWNDDDDDWQEDSDYYDRDEYEYEQQHRDRQD
jgi:hypothetical protein